MTIMDNETRQKRIEELKALRIKELKALRAELMAYKEASEGETGEGSSDSNAAMNSLRKDYIRDFDQETENTQTNRDELKRDMYVQQGDDSDDISTEKQLVLRRR